jgi:uncharacterized protein YunC (DUF1805 family)
VIVRNKPIACTSTGLITYGHCPAARIADVSMSESNLCLCHVAMEYIMCVYVCMHASWVCVSAACYVRCVVGLHGCCDPSVAASVSCALVRVVGGGRSLRIKWQSGAT